MERMGLEPGTEIGGYRIVNQLGAGAMGVVYRALDGGGTPVAFKILRSTAIGEDELRERLMREAASLRKVSHPAIAAMLDVETDSDETFIVTELIEGPTLESYVADNGPLEGTQLATLAERLYSALDAVHTANVVHRDLKPNNVLMGNQGAVLIDFGIAHGMQDPRLTATGLVVGTPGYLAPELINGHHPSALTDLWGWAAVLTFAATGRAPFGYGGFEAVITRAMAGKPDVDGLDERIAYALRGALAVKPENRWSPLDVIDELHNAAHTPGTVPVFYAHQEHAATEVINTPVPAPYETDGYGQDPYAGNEDFDATQIRTHTADDLPTRPIVGNGDAHTAVLPQQDGHTAVLPQSYDAPNYNQPGGYSQSGDDGTLDDHNQTQYPEYTPEDDYSEYPDSGYRRTKPRRRVIPFIAALVLVTVCAAWAPLITAGSLIVMLALYAIVGVAWDAFQTKRELKGPRKREGALAALALPWHLVKGLALFLPSLVFSGAMAALLGVMVYWAGTKELFGNSAARGLSREYEIIIALAVVVLFQMLLWYGPLTRHTRTGGRLVMQALFPGAFATMILVLLLLGVATYIGILVLGGAEMVWWPLQGVPSIGK